MNSGAHEKKEEREATSKAKEGLVEKSINVVCTTKEGELFSTVATLGQVMRSVSERRERRGKSKNSGMCSNNLVGKLFTGSRVCF